MLKCGTTVKLKMLEELTFDLLSVQADSNAQDTQIKFYKFSHKQHTVQQTEAWNTIYTSLGSKILL
jgi:hypothetical protein